jgi:hypothetical protein
VLAYQRTRFTIIKLESPAPQSHRKHTDASVWFRILEEGVCPLVDVSNLIKRDLGRPTWLMQTPEPDGTEVAAMGAPIPDARVERPILPQVGTHLFWTSDVVAVASQP